MSWLKKRKEVEEKKAVIEIPDNMTFEANGRIGYMLAHFQPVDLFHAYEKLQQEEIFLKRGDVDVAEKGTVIRTCEIEVIKDKIILKACYKTYSCGSMEDGKRDAVNLVRQVGQLLSFF